jgi:enoyl-CoA hydratase/carnithine racemase
MSEEIILNSLGNDVYEILLNRPERMNALGVATVKALEQAVAEAAAKHARVLLLRGSGRAFCTGADLKERKSMDMAARLTHNAGIRGAIDAVARAKCVTIAVLNGVAVGGGLELAMGCDLRFAAAGISLGLTESKVGAFPGAGGSQRLPRLVGASRAMHMMFTGEPVTSEYALSIGLVNEVVPADDLQAHTLAFAEKLASRSAPALATIKQLVYQGMELPLAAALRVERAALPEILGSADYAEGLAAFAERRPPKFTGLVE